MKYNFFKRLSGDDLMSYFYHYINYGMKEGRMGIPQQKTKAD